MLKNLNLKNNSQKISRLRKSPKSVKLLALILAVAITCAAFMTSCGGGAKGGDPVMKLNYGGGETVTVSSNIFSYYLSLCKTLELYQYNYFAQMYGMEEITDNPALWTEPYTIENEPSVSTYGDIIKLSAISEVKQMLAVQVYCRENNLILTKDQINEIDVAIKDLIKNTYNNSKVTLNVTLNRFGVNDKIYKEIKELEMLRTIFVDHLFSATSGIKAIPDSVVWQNFTDNYVKVKHILIRTVTDELDENGNPVAYSEEELAQRLEKANDIYAKINGGENFDDYYAESEDPGQETYPNGYCFTTNSGFYEEFENAAFDMKVDEVRMVETSVGMHIMKKIELTAEDISEYQSTILQGLQNNVIIETLQPYVDAIELIDEEISDFSVVTADTMLNCLDIIS